MKYSSKFFDIFLQPLEQIDHNGENFHYIVNYKRMDINGATPQSLRVYDWQASEVVIKNQPSFIYKSDYVNRVLGHQNTLYFSFIQLRPIPIHCRAYCVKT